jgi:5-methyltetrahydrofolate--homocysteine methyltransferase
MATLLPLARRWGAAVIGLPLDRRGIPPTAAGRLALIEKFIDRALNAGIALDDIYVDPLMLTAAQVPPAVTFETLRGVREAFGVRTVLGVSNVSHGLPRRDILNEAAFLYAAGAGLDVALVNPLDPRMAEAMAAAGVLTGGLDAATYARRQAPPRRAKAPGRGKRATPTAVLYDAVVEGRREEAAAAAARALKGGADPLALNRRGVAAALDEVGRRFERREFFLPQVIRAAEAAHAAFAVVLKALPRAKGRTAGRVILATVAGDVHDIGKNVVAAVLRSHGFDVRDLGKSVPPARLVAATRRFGADVVGLSALMTTTMPEMEKAAAALRAAGVKAKILVGGAVVTPAYAKRIGAAYAPDAVAAARVARRLVKR